MRTRLQAIAACQIASRTGETDRVGLCQARTRGKYLIPSDGSPDAATAHSRTKHRFTGLWVPGAFAWWTGGTHGHGHVAICAWRKGYVWTVDFKRPGKWDRVKLDNITKVWHLKFAGFSRDNDAKTILAMPAHPRKWAA
jgi:hypothetical protein